MKKTILLSIFYFLFSVLLAQAEDGLVPCGSGVGKACDFCDLIILINKIINFALYNIAIPLVVVMIVWGGLKIMTAGDSTEKVAEGRKIIQSAIIGVLIALGAWIILNTFLTIISGSSFQPWKWGGETPFDCPDTH